MTELSIQFTGNEPVTAHATMDCEKALGCKLPDDYLSFLQQYNGGEGYMGDAYLMLWKVEELVPFNCDYEVSSYCPDLLFIGSNGGGEAYAFDKRSSPWRVVQVPFVGMDYSLCEVLGISFSDFIKKLMKGNE